MTKPKKRNNGDRRLIEDYLPIEAISIELHLRWSRSQLYASFNALSNLAEKAGTIQPLISAESLQGFDPVWLRNAVIEPLDEAGVEMEMICLRFVLTFNLTLN
jgi:hypothetical protein